MYVNILYMEHMGSNGKSLQNSHDRIESERKLANHLGCIVSIDFGSLG